MRVFLLALMIVLLPLRGWVGDAMAMDTLAPATAHPATTAGPHAGHEAMADTAGDATPCADHAGTADDDHGCAQCVACNICHSAAHSPALWPLLTALPAAAPVVLAPGPVVSAERSTRFKPPIS